MKLPFEFEERMKKQLGDEYDAFENSYELEPYLGLRVNTLKISVEDFLKLFPYELTPIPWTDDGFYYSEEFPVTKHPLYYAGLYYIQEPSAMSPVTILKPEKNTISLDLCAAPGGKTLQIAAYTEDTGLLVTNDLSEKRVKAIVRNIEKYGVKNALVLNENQYNIADKLSGLFENILIDAPCSGEGMFKKDTKAMKAWKSYANETCAKMQAEILQVLSNLASERARVVYSTCTFSPVENEEQLEKLILNSENIEFEKIESEHFDVSERGYAYLWPHKLKGEGHFIGKLSIKENTPLENKRIKPLQYSEEAPIEFRVFQDKYMNTKIEGKFYMEKERLILLPEKAVPVDSLHVARYGWLLGEIKRDKFIPSQAFAMGIRAKDFKTTVDLSMSSKAVMQFLKGETLFANDIDARNDGYCLICTEGYPLGFVKVEGSLVKNLYPVSWRMIG